MELRSGTPALARSLTPGPAVAAQLVHVLPETVPNLLMRPLSLQSLFWNLPSKVASGWPPRAL